MRTDRTALEHDRETIASLQMTLRPQERGALRLAEAMLRRIDAVLELCEQADHAADLLEVSDGGFLGTDEIRKAIGHE